MQRFLESLVARYNLTDSVQFLGQVGHTDLLHMYEAGDIDMIVLPTLHEGIPVCLMEAMAYGVPVVSTPVGGIPELLRDGAGIMVPSKAPLALADAIEQVINDGELRKRMSQAGRQRVEEKFLGRGGDRQIRRLHPERRTMSCEDAHPLVSIIVPCRRSRLDWAVPGFDRLQRLPQGSSGGVGRRWDER